MENIDSTPKKSSRGSCFSSEPRYLRTPLSVLQNTKDINNKAHTPSRRGEFNINDQAFLLDMLEYPKSSEKASKLPLPLLVQPSKHYQPKDISSILHSLRTKNIKSILKNPLQPGQKTVHFTSEVEKKENPIENKTHSIATTTNSVTESRLEQPIEENKHEFKYEEDIKSSLAISDIDEYPIVAYCTNCHREIVTSVVLEKIRKNTNFISNAHWFLCLCLPACLFSNTNLVHRCSICSNEIARIISN